MLSYENSVEKATNWILAAQRIKEFSPHCELSVNSVLKSDAGGGAQVIENAVPAIGCRRFADMTAVKNDSVTE